MTTKPTVAVLGGTGDLGTGLARRWAKAGYTLLIGSRAADKAVTAAHALAALATGAKPVGMSNLDAAKQAEVVVITVPFASAAPLLDEIKTAVQGKLVIDTTVPTVRAPANAWTETPIWQMTTRCATSSALQETWHEQGMPTDKLADRFGAGVGLRCRNGR